MNQLHLVPGPSQADFDAFKSTLRRVLFELPVSAWQLVDGAYVAEYPTEWVTANSIDWIMYDDSYRTALRADISEVKITGGGGIKFTTAVKPAATLSGEIRAMAVGDDKVAMVVQDTAMPTLRDVPFTIYVSDWELNEDDVYEALFETAYVTESSKDWIEFDESVDLNATAEVKAVKQQGGGGIVFKTSRLPEGNITGTILPFDNGDGKILYAVQDTVIPIANGGTGGSNLAMAQENLGIAALQDSITSLITKATGTTPTYQGVTTIPYPSGFDANNTLILGFRLQNELRDGWYSNSWANISISPHANGIRVYSNWNVPALAGGTIEVFITKI